MSGQDPKFICFFIISDSLLSNQLSHSYSYLAYKGILVISSSWSHKSNGTKEYYTLYIDRNNNWIKLLFLQLVTDSLVSCVIKQKVNHSCIPPRGPHSEQSMDVQAACVVAAALKYPSQASTLQFIIKIYIYY